MPIGRFLKLQLGMSSRDNFFLIVTYAMNLVNYLKIEWVRCRSLQRTLAELREYQQKHDSWKQQQQKLVSEQASRMEKIEQTVSYETYKLRLANEGVGQHVTAFVIIVTAEYNCWWY